MNEDSKTIETSNEETSSGNEPYKREEYITLFEHSFSDIITLSEGDRALFEELYYNRDAEFADFRNAAEKLYNNGNNILVIGAAGIGKSNYVYRLFYDKELLERAKLYPIMFDYSEITPNNLEGWKLHFIEGFDGFFKSIGHSTEIKKNEIVNIDDNLFIIQKSFKNIPEERMTKHPLLFIDDLDYAEQDRLFELLEFLSPYARNQKIHLLLSVRPPLYHSINNNDFKYRFLFVNNVKQITLHPLNIHNVLSTRLAPIIAFNPDLSFFDKVKNVISRLKDPISKYKGVLKKLGINNLDDLSEFPYPFADDYINFMNKITNGNLREIFDIAIDSLCYILKNYNKLETVEINGIIRKKIKEDQAVDLFFNNASSKYKLFNIHQQLNPQGNSLHFNVLEALQSFGCSSKLGFYEILLKFGHSKNDVDNSLKELARRQNRLVICNNFTYAVDGLDEKKKYEIAEKGKYYLEEVVKWNRYIERCGKSKKSIIDNIRDQF